MGRVQSRLIVKFITNVRMRVLLIEEKKLWLFSLDPSIIIKIDRNTVEPPKNEVKGEGLIS